MKPFRVADLFCGAGGTSTGAIQACLAAGRRAELVAVNHWERAVETHAANHPHASHHCEDLTTMDPRKAVPGGKLDLLVASPECTHHSVARGGMPCSDQSRASAWCVMRWVTSLQVDRVLIENVPEFVSWGPLGTNGKPLASRRGEIFKSFVDALKAREAALKPDKEKLSAWAFELRAIKSPGVKSAEAKKAVATAMMLLNDAADGLAAFAGVEGKVAS